jgi:hypothetical protein
MQESNSARVDSMKTYSKPVVRNLGSMSAVTQKTGANNDGSSNTKKGSLSPLGF